MKYSTLAEVYERLSSTTKNLEKTAILADFIKGVPEEDLQTVILLLRGRAFPEWDQRVIGMGDKLVIKAISSASGLTETEVTKAWKEIGDLGKVAEQLIKKKRQTTLFSQQLTVKHVFEILQKISTIEGGGSVSKKIDYIRELLTSADPLSAKYITRTLLEDLRVGAGEGILRAAIAKAFEVDEADVERAHNMLSDFGEVALRAKKGARSIKSAKLKIGQPIKVMLYPKVKDISEGFEVVGKPAACEYKIDGFRMEVHRKGNSIKLFTRRLDDVTKQFPDIVELVKSNIKSEEYIIDSEVIGIEPKTKQWLPFQNISERIKRKYDIIEIIKKIPIQIMPFDVLYFEGEDFIDKAYSERRRVLEKIVKNVPDRLLIMPQIVASNLEDAEKFYKESLARGNEGIMMKSLSSEYTPGARVGGGVKIKPVMESLDLVIVGAEWGTGKRAGWLSSFELACHDPESGEFLPLGKMGTGVKEKAESEGVSFEELTKILKKFVISEEGKNVIIKPNVVVEIAYEEIQKSPTYKSGFALRFPRLLRLRSDRSADEADTIKRVKALFEGQRGRGK